MTGVLPFLWCFLSLCNQAAIWKEVLQKGHEHRFRNFYNRQELATFMANDFDT